MKILHLKITTWAGISIGATHYYGDILFPYEEHKDSHRLRFILAKRDVILLNKKERMYASTFRTTYVVGEESERFDTKEEIEKTGIKYYEENLKKKYAILVLGDTGVIEPKKIIVHNCKSSRQLKLIESINEIAKQYDYEDACDTVHNSALFKKWAPLWKQLTGESWE